MSDTPTPQSQTLEGGSDLHNQLVTEHFDGAQKPPVGATSENDDAAAKKFDDAQKDPTEPKPAPVKAERPANVPEKFWNAETGVVDYEALLADYDAIQKGEKKPDEKAPDEKPAVQEAKAALETVGLDYDKYSKEYAETGKLSEATYAEMEAKNIPRAIVDAHIRGAEAEAVAIRDSVFAVVGGEDNFSSMAQWATANVPAAELAAFNKTIDSGDIEAVKLAVAGLNSKYTNAIGQEPTLVHGDGTKVAGDVFRSTRELTDAMRDPRYRTDSAYRADVEAKLSRSNIMG